MQRHVRISLHLAAALFKRMLLYSLILCGFAYLCVWWTLPGGGLNVQFRSSDGHWSRSERLLKGIGLKQIAIGFEVYKINCNAPTAQLQRLTPTPTIWSLEWWTEDLDDPKWQVPFVQVDSAAGAKHRSRLPDCAQLHLSAQNRLEVMERANQWLRSLGWNQ